MARSYRDILKLGRGGSGKAAVAAPSAEPMAHCGLPKRPTSPSSVPASAGFGETSGEMSENVFYVHMRKSKNYTPGGWRRDLMRSELGDVDIAEVSGLTDNGRRDAETVLRLWRQNSDADATAPTPSVQNWQRAMRRSLTAVRGTSAEVAAAASAPKAVTFVPSVSDVDEEKTIDEETTINEETTTSSRSVADAWPRREK